MNEKWTPGPWRLRFAFAGRDAEDPYGFGVFPAVPTIDLPKDIDQHSIAAANLYEHSAFTAFYSVETIRANAHLIAAAPDLYEALDALINDSARPGMKFSDRIRLGVAALAKARGEEASRD